MKDNRKPAWREWAPSNAEERLVSSTPRAERLQQLGILDYESLKSLANAQRPLLVDSLIGVQKLALLVGDSGLGKTPFAVQLGVCVASGRPFLGARVEQGEVLYCDAESGAREMADMICSTSTLVGLNEPPQGFRLWPTGFVDVPLSPPSLGEHLLSRVEAVRPKLVIVDTLRQFWPEAPEKAQDAAQLIAKLRKVSRECECSWLILHHRRKRNLEYPVDLVEDPHGWFQEAAGSLALINGVDSRLGLDEAGPGEAEADLVFGGFVRSSGKTPVRHLQRRLDEASGDPLGYQVLGGLDRLNANYKQAFQALPVRFRFKDAKTRLGNSGSNVVAFLKKCEGAGLLRRDGREYVKIEES